MRTKPSWAVGPTGRSCWFPDASVDSRSTLVEANHGTATAAVARYRRSRWTAPGNSAEGGSGGDGPGHCPIYGLSPLEFDRPGWLGGQQLMDGGDGAVVVAQQDEFASPGLKPDRASNYGTKPSKNLHGRQVVPTDSDTLKITPLDRRAALVREVLDERLAHDRHGQGCRTLRGDRGDPAVGR